MRQGVSNVCEILYEPLVETSESDEATYIFHGLRSGPRLNGHDFVGMGTYAFAINEKATKFNFSHCEGALLQFAKKAFFT